MGRKVSQIQKLNRAESFIQLNFTKGFKYVDRAGEFINNLYKDDKFPKHIMTPEGLTAVIDEKIELKTSSHNLWLHFLNPENFSIQKNTFLNNARLVNNLFEPEKYNRIGWRSHFIYNCNENCPEIIPKDFLFDGDLNEFTFTKKINNIDCKVRIVKLNEDNNILFDFDFYIKEDFLRKDFKKIIEYLEKIEESYESDELLIIINKLLK